MGWYGLSFLYFILFYFIIPFYYWCAIHVYFHVYMCMYHRHTFVHVCILLFAGVLMIFVGSLCLLILNGGSSGVYFSLPEFFLQSIHLPVPRPTGNVLSVFYETLLEWILH